MGRTGQAENSAANTEMAATQAKHEANVESDRSSYLSGLQALEAQGNPYENSDYKNTENLLASEGAGAANASAKESVDNAVGRTGTNTSSMPYYTAMMAKDRMRSQGATLVAQKASDTDKANQWRQWLVGAKLAPSGIDTSMFGAATQGRDAALGNLTQLGLASYGPVNSAIAATGAAIGGACPAKGSMILMADGSEKPVEELKQGDEIAQYPDGSGVLLSTPSPMRSRCVLVTCFDEKTRKVSDSHTFLVAYGGYVNAAESRGWAVAAQSPEASTINDVREADGMDEVYPLQLSQNHTYCADGVWGLE